MKKEQITVNLENGLEATPAAMLVQIASKYESIVHIEAQDGAVKVNAKSIMGMMSLGLNAGDRIAVIAEGSDEEAAAREIVEYLSGR